MYKMHQETQTNIQQKRKLQQFSNFCNWQERKAVAEQRGQNHWGKATQTSLNEKFQQLLFLFWNEKKKKTENAAARRQQSGKGGTDTTSN